MSMAFPDDSARVRPPPSAKSVARCATSSSRDRSVQEPGPAADWLHMTNSRWWLTRATRPLLIVAAFVSLASLSPLAAEPEPVTPLSRLRIGNERFVKGALTTPSLGAAARQAQAKDEHPFAMVLSCADSRVPPEFIFNAGLGDLYVVRAAGEVVDRSVLATIEHGVEQLHIPLLVVMGHESCSVVKAALGSEPRRQPESRLPHDAHPRRHPAQRERPERPARRRPGQRGTSDQRRDERQPDREAGGRLRTPAGGGRVLRTRHWRRGVLGSHRRRLGVARDAQVTSCAAPCSPPRCSAQP